MNRKAVATLLLSASLMSLQPTTIRAEAASKKTITGAAKHTSAVTPTNEQNLDRAIAELNALATQQIDNKVIPGLAIAIVKDDKVVFAKGFGVRQLTKPEAVDADTVFQMASVSKCITSSVVAALVSEGKVTWDSRVSNLDPAFQMNDAWVTRQITIRDFLCHRSGLPEHAGDLLEDIGYDRSQVLYRLRFQKPDSSFRSKYAYTNFGYTEGALAAAKTCNSTWEDVAESKLFKPLAMNSTSARYSDFMARSNKALNHVLVDGTWVHKFQRDPEAQSPAGGVSSSANDMAKWMIMEIGAGKYQGQQLIAAKAIEETHHPEMLTGFNPSTGLPGFYGLGFNVSYDQKGRLHISHSGAFCLGAATCVYMVPSEKLGICILTNAYPIGVAEGLAQTFVDTALNGKCSRDWLTMFKKIFSNPEVVGITKGTDYSAVPSSPTAALTSDAYIGKYTNEFFGDIEIVENNGALAAILGPKRMTVPLKHYDRDMFTCDIETENMTGESGLIFTVTAGGKAESVLVEDLAPGGNGLFHRVAAEREEKH